MATHLAASSRATSRASPFPKTTKPLFFPLEQSFSFTTTKARIIGGFSIRASNDGSSYLDMWKNAVDRQKKTVEFENIAGRIPGDEDGTDAAGNGAANVDVSKKNDDFQKILEVDTEERDRIQRMQVIDRAAAAIAAARAILKEKRPLDDEENAVDYDEEPLLESKQEGSKSGNISVSQTESSRSAVPGPDFWSWTPPADTDSPRSSNDNGFLEPKKALTNPVVEIPLAVKEKSLDVLPIPFESKLSQSSSKPRLPPLQSLMEVKKEEVTISSTETPSLKEEEQELDLVFGEHSIEIAHVLDAVKDEVAFSGTDPDGSRWWKEKGVEERPDGVICRWTMIRGVKGDQDVEWQEKFWEASDEFGHKELGSEKSGRDATGNVWREYWTESMWQESGLVHLEKTADKWGKNGNGDEWQEQWWEHYDASNKAEKWAHKWCTIDPTTQLDAGHAHVWHERWGETYDGHGGSVKYTDKWAERCEGDGWTKWGDKWDEHFDPNGHGVKQGETWWEGKQYGERWNRTWGERHNGSGWVHKYGKSSCGEHWDTHEPQETWYERFPHYGFYHCFENSPQLQQVQNLSEIQEPPQLQQVQNLFEIQEPPQLQQVQNPSEIQEP
ncbi:protein LIKE EARLY STARVATION, chloroplastic [Euphorbia lathyris]|uniref:protein LIKE EARLY STARVATION, chloroplastic n=1 Tax=Euphorbia lathyris TaxID=212925 RepID=UPI00331428C1